MRVLYQNKPVLAASTLIAAMVLNGCQSSMFKSDPVPTPRYVPTIILGEAQNLTILPTRVPCSSALPMQCLLAKTASSGEIFQIPYDWIEGFEPRTGIEYQIVARPQVDEALGQPTGHWTLQTINSQR